MFRNEGEDLTAPVKSSLEITLDVVFIIFEM